MKSKSLGLHMPELLSLHRKTVLLHTSLREHKEEEEGAQGSHDPRAVTATRVGPTNSQQRQTPTCPLPS